MPTNELKTWQAQAQAQTELLLVRLMPSENQLPQSLHETMRYAALDGGKRLRPLLVLAASELGEAVPDAVEAAMAAIELIPSQTRRLFMISQPRPKPDRRLPLSAQRVLVRRPSLISL